MAIERSDVCVIMIDATEGVTEQDTKAVSYTHLISELVSGSSRSHNKYIISSSLLVSMIFTSKIKFINNIKHST